MTLRVLCVLLGACAGALSADNAQERSLDAENRFPGGYKLDVIMVEKSPFARYNQSWYNSQSLWDGWLVDVLEHIASPDKADFEYAPDGISPSFAHFP